MDFHNIAKNAIHSRIQIHLETSGYFSLVIALLTSLLNRCSCSIAGTWLARQTVWYLLKFSTVTYTKTL